MPIKHDDGRNLAKAPRDKYIEDLKKYTKCQLFELRDRQKKLLANKFVFGIHSIRCEFQTKIFICRSWLSKLPDKGKQIQSLSDRIVKEIEARNEIDQAAALFSELNIVEKGVKAVNNMEWNGGNVDGNQIVVAADTLDSDDDEDTNIDPLKIIAQSREIKLVKIEKPIESLITEADLEEIKSMKAANDTMNGESSTNSDTKNEPENNLDTTSGSVDFDPHAMYLMKMDESFTEKSKSIKKFLPFKTTKSDVHNVERERNRKYGPHWEVTAATPPNLRNNSVQMLSLHESIEMERQHKEKLREHIEKQAEERLEMRKKIIADNISLLPPGSSSLDPNAFFRSYRQREDKYNELEESEDDVYSENSYDGDEPESHGVSVVVCDH